MATSKSTASSSKPASDEVDIDKILKSEASAFQREVEVERILKGFKFNPYDILDIKETATADEIKKKYRQISLFIHPDKCTHARAPEAFDILKKAESDLSDKAKREELDAVINEARKQVLISLKLPVSTPETDPQLEDLEPSFKVRLRTYSKQLLVEEEVRRRTAIKNNLANEGLEAKKKEDEVSQRKRKAEDDKLWEENREQRVGSWRTFANTNKKKKKAKNSLLG
ncbi:DnaJ-domain-containing protein [Crepidotus variabilis]|uniref:DnaJ-domain-containing protein n=1 Tax=Crepidotus variabilis TaxID=179855 RepID=A0A9P6EB63_9AGAR|nr:DnaJ-domain-containing protein [Crepidotus variabilis]